MGKVKAAKGKGKKAKPPKGANGTADPALAAAAALGLEVLTLEEAAASLRVSADVLRAEAEKGTIPARNLGGEWRFFTHALRDWLTHPRSVRLHPSDLGGPVGMGRITKAVPGVPTTSNAGQLSVIGSMADDETLLELTEEIYRRRTEEG